MKKELTKLKKKVGKMINSEEVKRYPLSVAAAQYTRTWNFSQITGIQTGTSFSERTGNNIQPYLLDLHFYVQGAMPQPATLNPQPYRIIVFQELATDGAVPTISEILAATTVTTGLLADNLSAYNYNYVTSAKVRNNRYRILYDHSDWVVPVASGYGKCARHHKVHIPGKRLMDISYVDNTSGGARAGRIYVAWQAGLSITLAENNFIGMEAQLRYLDG